MWHSFWLWVYYNSPTVQAVCAALALVAGAATLIYLVRYSEDTRKQRVLAEKQFQEVVAENQQRRILEHQRLGRADKENVPSIELRVMTAAYTGAPNPMPYKLSVRNVGWGVAQSIILKPTGSERILLKCARLEANNGHSYILAGGQLRTGEGYLLTYRSSGGSSIAERYIFTGTDLSLLHVGITADYDFLLN